MCEHPLSDITIAGEAVHPLPIVFHTFLQSVSDVMMYLPQGSALQVIQNSRMIEVMRNIMH